MYFLKDFLSLQKIESMFFELFQAEFFLHLLTGVYTPVIEMKNFRKFTVSNLKLKKKNSSKIHIQTRKVFSERPCGAANSKISLKITLFCKKLKFKQARLQHEVQKTQWRYFLHVFLFSVLDRRPFRYGR